MFQCQKCDKIFKLKTDLERHYKRKIPCTRNKLSCCYCDKIYKSRAGLSKHRKKCKEKQKKEQKDDTNMTLNNSYIIDEVEHHYSNSQRIPIYNVKSVSSINIDLTDKISCTECGKLFNSRSSMYRHRKNYCSKKRMNFEKEKDLEQKYQEIVEKVANLEESLKKTNSIVENQISLNSYGKEDLTWLQDNFYTILQKSCDIDSLDEFIKFGFQQMHCNPHRISNNNVNVHSKKDYFEQNIMSVYRDKKWELEENHKVIYNSFKRFINLVDSQIFQKSSEGEIHENMRCSIEHLIKLVQEFDENDDNNIEKTILNSVKPGIFVLVDNFKKSRQIT